MVDQAVCDECDFIFLDNIFFCQDSHFMGLDVERRI